MKISKRLTKGCAWALAFLLTVPFMGHMQTRAANGIEVGRTDCSITVSAEQLMKDETTEYSDTYEAITIPVSLYRVADVNVSGKLTAVSSFNGLDFSKVGPAGSTDKAAVWRDLAEKAEEQAEGVEPDYQKDVTLGSGPGEQGTSATFSDLPTGLYLIAPAEVYNSDYSAKYVFTPYLTALPSSQYALTGTGSDEWVYDTEVGLKMEREQQYGSLSIHKTLENYNTSLGQTTFVFQIDGQDKNGVPVYSNVVSTTYSGSGDKEIVVENIPAGIEVRVTEVYSGASYVVQGDAEQTVKVMSDAAVDAGAGEASVSFTNRYSGGNRGGYGVTNQFDKDDDNNWQWKQAAD